MLLKLKTLKRNQRKFSGKVVFSVGRHFKLDEVKKYRKILTFKETFHVNLVALVAHTFLSGTH